MAREMVKNHQTPDVECAYLGCDNTYRDHRWGATKAHDAGWFIQKNGDAWCPEHVPKWVKSWRARRKG